MAFAWLGWINITLLILGSIYFAFRSRGWNDDMCDTWGVADK